MHQNTMYIQGVNGALLSARACAMTVCGMRVVVDGSDVKINCYLQYVLVFAAEPCICRLLEGPPQTVSPHRCHLFLLLSSSSLSAQALHE